MKASYRGPVISMGNTKLGKVMNISLPPVISCGSFAPCRIKGCYARKLYALRPSVKDAWNHNLMLAITDHHYYFGCILAKVMPATGYFRWHVSGDILNQHYLEGMQGVAYNAPHVRFMCFTKMYHLDYDGIPKNLKIIFSAWPGHPLPPRPKRGFPFPVAYMQDGEEDRIPASAIECSGKCDTCMKCWELRRGQSVWFHKH